MESSLAPIFSKPLRSVHVLRHVIPVYRERESLTQENLANNLGVSVVDIQSMENGDFSSVSAETFFRVLMALRIDLNVSERKRPTAVDIEKESYARRFRNRP